MENFLWGLLAGLVVTIIVAIYLSAKRARQVKALKKEVEKYKNMVTDRMDLESEGLNKLKAQVEDLKKQNENLRITVNTLSQKPGRRELDKLQIYQTAVDRLTINSPGFGAAWQSALRESEEDFKKMYVGTLPLIRKVIPGASSAKLITEDDEDFTSKV